MRSRLNPTAQPFYPSAGGSANPHITMAGIYITETWIEKAYRLRLEQEQRQVEMEHSTSNITSKPRNEFSPFFRLPRELRDMVYCYVLEPNERWDEDHLGPGVMRVTLEGASKTCNTGITLLSANKQLHQEGVECLYGDNRFEFDDGAIIPFLNRIGTNTSQIRRIIISARRVGYDNLDITPHCPRPSHPHRTPSPYERVVIARQEREAIRGLCPGLNIVEMFYRELLDGDFASMMFVLQNDLVYGSRNLYQRPIILKRRTDTELDGDERWEKIEELAKILGWSIRNAKPAPW